MFPFPFPPVFPGSLPRIDGIARIENALTFAASSGGALRLKIGDVVKADVLTLMADGTVSIRITKESGESAVVSARTRVPLDAGECVLLKVTDGDGEISLQFLGTADRESGRSPDPAGTRAPASDARRAQQTFRAFPESVKSAIPGFSRLEGAPGMERLTGEGLREAVEGSGVLLETKLALEAEGVPRSADRKEALLRVGQAMRELGGSAAVRGSGISPGETAVKVDGMLSTIESYQVSSAVHGVLHAPLALDWEELEDGEILFRRRDRGKGQSYTCTMNLDLAPIGKLAVSVTMYDGSFFVSLSPESEETRALLASRSDEVGKRFREAGLALSALAVQRRERVAFGVPSADGIDLEA
ncbi:MAG: flagellar hook-length control protein FliK [Thermodesulfobacteriota bacterium]